MSVRAPHLRRGDYAERVAWRHLQTHGLTLVRRNWRCKLGEIDLICADGDCIVFVEVRYRRNPRYGFAAETVDRHKQAKLIRAAKFFLQRYPEYRDRPLRFDVVAVQGRDEELTLEWIPDAFQVVA